ncbi:MAG: hypothetical protein GEU79_12260 [Acidimicrobiia bacterium]|nr:hypothetical protein [Acidimicrobiia bacterium]
MNIDDRGRRAANAMRNARRETEFSAKSPSQLSGPSLWPMLATAVVAVAALIGLAQLIGTDPDTVTGTSTTPVETTVPASSTVPATTLPPSTTAPPTTETPTTTTPPTTAPTTTVPVTVPNRAIAQTGGNLVWVDTSTGETEIIHEAMFEAAAAVRMSMSPDGSRVYYQLSTEDNWFSCESVQGEVTIMDIASGETTTVTSGLPALSPDGQRLAYLGSEGDGCLPDPTNPAFFVPAYDVLVITDRDGNELVRVPVESDVGSPEEALQNLVWLDDSTVLVSDGSGTHYRVPTDVSTGIPLRDHETMDLPAMDLFVVIDDRGIGAEFDPVAGYGPLQIVDLVTGDVTPIVGDPHGTVGMSSDGAIIISSHTPSAQLLLDVDLATGEPVRVLDVAEFINAIDW